MTVTASSLADARDHMVDGQLRPNKVTDRRILHAMRQLRREDFAPAHVRALAYADVEVDVGNGRYLLAPMVVARLIQSAQLPSGSTALVIGAGYAAAVLAACDVQVTAVEQDMQMLRRAEAAYAANQINLRLVHGELGHGWPDAAPYDAILVDGAVTTLPVLGDQLRLDPPGRLCAIMLRGGRNGVAVVAERAQSGLSQRTVMDCTATLTPQFAPDRRFSF